MHRHYRKLIAGIVGITALLANRYLGWEVRGDVDRCHDQGGTWDVTDGTCRNPGD